MDNFEQLSSEVCACRLCPRLVQFRENVAVRTPPLHEEPWRRPIPGFGDPHAWLLILGLAPSANGGNRTGRIFTGDLSGKFLMGCLYNTGFANQPHSEHRNDGLQLKGCYITPGVKCVPPENRPNQHEIITCRRYLKREIALLASVKTVLVLGQMSLKMYRDYLQDEGHVLPALAFRHGAVFTVENLPTVYASYHPSPQNTQTGKLTSEMFESLLRRIIAEIKT